MQPTLKPTHRRSRKQTRVEQRPVLQLPVPRPESYGDPKTLEDTEENESARSHSRGVAVVDFYV